MIQQFTHVNNRSRFNFAQRLSADQTFAPDKDDSFRFRYRMSLLFPLSGDAIDVKEYYIKVNNEYVNRFRGGDYDLEIRLGPTIGHKFKDSNKLEVGLDYRINSFFNGSPNHKFRFSLNWFLAI